MKLLSGQSDSDHAQILQGCFFLPQCRRFLLFSTLATNGEHKSRCMHDTRQNPRIQSDHLKPDNLVHDYSYNTREGQFRLITGISTIYGRTERPTNQKLDQPIGYL